MPFPAQEPRPFTFTEVAGLHPRQYGCYGLFNRFGCVYIGKGDIRERLLAHLRGDNPLITLFGPTHWMGIVTPVFDYLEKQLIWEFNPAANLRVG